MSDSPVIRLINAMVEAGALTPAEAAQCRIQEAKFRGGLSSFRDDIREVAAVLGLDDLDDHFLWDCLRCIVNRHDFRQYNLVPETRAMGGIKIRERCVRCKSFRYSVRNEYTGKSRRQILEAQKGDDRERYLEVYHRIEYRHASLALEVAGWYELLEAKARGRVQIPEPLRVF